MKNKLSLKGFRTSSSLAISSSDCVDLIAKDAMIKPVFLYPDDDAKKIIKKRRKESTNVCIVVTKEKQFLGEISNEDLIKFFINQINNEPLTEKLNVGYRKKFLFKSAKELVNNLCDEGISLRAAKSAGRLSQSIAHVGYDAISVAEFSASIDLSSALPREISKALPVLGAYAAGFDVIINASDILENMNTTATTPLEEEIKEQLFWKDGMELVKNVADGAGWILLIVGVVCSSPWLLFFSITYFVCNVGAYVAKRDLQNSVVRNGLRN